MVNNGKQFSLHENQERTMLHHGEVWQHGSSSTGKF